MCGIIGYVGDRDASNVVARGLEKLEYRGYDSAGIAVSGNSIEVEKGEGTVSRIETPEAGESGVGHTRWATHGGVNDRNAHPHTDCGEELAVTHNGIIKNYEELREELEGQGHAFDSETDSEIIPHLLEEYLDEMRLIEAVEKVKDRLEGSYAVAAVLDSGEVVAFREKSPLAVGFGKEEYFVGSDVTPFLEYTDKAVFLEDGETVVIDGEPCFFQNGKKVERSPERIDWNASEASREDHEHFMMKEVMEQPETVERATYQDRKDMEEAVEMIKEAETVYLTGCGTASFAAEMGAKYLRREGVKAVWEQAHEMEYRAENIGEDDLIIAVSQSGETADLLSLLRKIDAEVLSVVNVVGSTLSRESNHALYINAGPEIGVASTKAFTGQLTVLKLLKYALTGKFKEGKKSLKETADKIKEVLEQEELEELAEYLSEKEHAFTIGRDKGSVLAKEAALKLKELSYIHVEAFPGGEFKHGTLALIEEDTPVISFINHDKEEIKSNSQEADSRGATVISTGSEKEGFDHCIEIPEDRNSEILEIVPFQLLAYKTSKKKGNNPDKPRNLAKSVTVK